MIKAPIKQEQRREFNLQQTVTVNRWITHFLAQPKQENWLKQEGAFRLSGNDSKVDKIINSLLDNKTLITEEYGRDDYISALKKVHNNSILLPKNDTEVSNLLVVIQTGEKDQASRALSQFIDTFARSGDQNKMAVAEILYNYLHILSLAERQKATNKMGASNLGIVMAPFIADHILQAVDPNGQLTLTLKEICAPLIAGDEYLANTFHVKYADQINSTTIRALQQKIDRVRVAYCNILAKEPTAQDNLKKLIDKRDIFNQMIESLIMKKGVLSKEDYQQQMKQFEQELGSLESQINIHQNIANLLSNELETKRQEIALLEDQISELRSLMGQTPLLKEALPTVAVQRHHTILTPINHDRPVFDPSDDQTEQQSLTPSFPGSPLSANSLESTPNHSRHVSPERTTSLLFQGPRAESISENLFNFAWTEARSQPRQDKVIKILVEKLKAEGHSLTLIGKALYEHRSLLTSNQEELGEFFAINDPENKQILEAYVQQFEMMNHNFAESLKFFLENSGFKLASEGQKIPRILEAFANHYYRSNPLQYPSKPEDKTKGADKLYLLAVCVLQLNTDLHNPAVTTKMTKKQFAAQVKLCAIDDKIFAKTLYKYIKDNEIKMLQPEVKGKQQLKSGL